MINAVPLACFLSMIRPPGVQFDNALLQIAPVDKTKCPLVRDSSDVTFQLFTRYNPTTFQELVVGDDDKLLASHMNFHDHTVIYFHAFMEVPTDGSAVLVREAYMLRGDVNMIMVDASQLEAGPWYFTAADNTWYIGRFAAKFIDYLVSRGLDLSKTHLVGHSLGAQAAGVAGAYITSGRVSRITGLDPALPLFAKLPLEQRLDPSDADFVDVIHTDAGIFGVNFQSGHADFYPNGGISPQPGCELEVVLHQQQFLNKFFCSHWRSYMFYAESVLRPDAFVAAPCESWRGYKAGACAGARRAHMGFAAEPTNMKPQGYYLFELQPVDTKKQAYTRTDTKQDLDVNINMTEDSQYPDKYDIDTTYKKNARYSTYTTENKKINTKSKYDHVKDLESADTIHMKDLMYKKTKDTANYPKPNSKYYTKYSIPESKLTNYDILKDLDSSDETESSLDLIAAEADLEETLTRLKLKADDNTQEKNTKETNADFINHKTLLESFPHNTYLKESSMDMETSTQTNSHVKKRQKRFLNFFQKSEATENENFLFRILEFVNKNRKNVIPVFTVMREINTLVKSANGELNHSTKERNNYIGHNPPVLPFATYNLELGSDSKAKAFVKRLLGLKVQGDRLSITGK